MSDSEQQRTPHRQVLAQGASCLSREHIMNTQTTQITTSVMTKQEAQEKHAQIIELSGQYIDRVGPIALEMREREGWRALGCKNWTDYCQRVHNQISAVNVMRLAQKAEVEQNVQSALPMRHALVLARLPSPEAQQEVFETVKKHYAKPVQQNFQTGVDVWFRDHDKPLSTGRERSKEGWHRTEVEEDSELSEALNRIEEVYGHKDRKAIQEGTIGLTRKDIIALAAFHETKMKEVHYLIVANHWDVASAMKFVNSTPSADTTVHELQNHCLSTSGFYYTCSVEEFDITIQACKALANKAKGQANGLS